MYRVERVQPSGNVDVSLCQGNVLVFFRWVRLDMTVCMQSMCSCRGIYPTMADERVEIQSQRSSDSSTFTAAQSLDRISTR